MTLARRSSVSLFAALAATVYAIVFLFARQHVGAHNAAAIGMGAACDLTVTVPVLFYFLLVRPGYSSWMALAAIVMAGARAAGFLLPAAAQIHLPGLRWLGVPFELWVLLNLARGRRRGWAARLLSSELQVFYFALFSWRARPAAPPDSRAFQLAQASGYAMLSVLMIVALIVEGVPMHLLLDRASPVAAWILTALGAYSILWMVALYRSLALRPILLTAETLVLQAGFLWRVELRRDRIARIRAFSAMERNFWSMTVINEPQWLLELREPASVEGPFGRRKTVTRIALAVDDPAAFHAALTAPSAG